MMRALVVDGYNVMHASDRYRMLADRDLDAARAAIVSDVAAYTQGSFEGLVVFDGASNPASDGARHEVAGVTVIFSPFGRDADSIIELEMARLRSVGREVVLVTSDAETQWVALGMNVLRVSSAQFVSDLEGHAEEGADFTPTGSLRSTLDARIDATTREALARWARGGR